MFKIFFLFFLVMSSALWAQKGEELIHLKFAQTEIEQKNYFVIQMQLESGWHVYWKNPGDSGIPTQWNLNTKNNSMQFEMKEWPHPKIFKEAGDLWTLGYDDEQHFFAEIKNGKNTSDELQLNSDFLVCKEVCIPARIVFAFDIEGGKIQIPNDNKIADDVNLSDQFQLLPFESNAKLEFELYQLENSTQLRLVLPIPNNTSAKNNYSIFTPFPALPFNFKHNEIIDQKVIFDIDWDGAYQEPKMDLPTNGQFIKPFVLKFLLLNTPSQIISLELQKFTILNNAKWNELKVAQTPAQAAPTSILLMLLFAFLGGLILNFMPCVLPVITLKLYSLLHHQQKTRAEIIKHNSSYTLGILSCFWILAAIIVVLRTSGHFIGWGFQLQSPYFVWSMILLFFILSLNLFGLFEFKTPAGKIISNLRSHHPYIDDYFAGLLAVIVATPCSAPFLGPALTYAFSTNTFSIILIFTFMGLGLASPFLLTALYPKFLSVLPRPGSWMNTFKHLMGFALLTTVIWLFEVLQALTDFSALSFSLYLTLALIFFTIFILNKDTKQRPLITFMLLFTLSSVYRSYQNISLYRATSETKTNAHKGDWIPWTQEGIESLSHNKELFFVDATAKWCITCQVNKKLVLETDHFEELKKQYNFKTIRLDWTQQDPIMFQWMQKNGAVSVPAYFVGRDGKILFLGETISFTKVEDAFKNP